MITTIITSKQVRYPVGLHALISPLLMLDLTFKRNLNPNFNDCEFLVFAAASPAENPANKQNVARYESREFLTYK